MIFILTNTRKANRILDLCIQATTVLLGMDPRSTMSSGVSQSPIPDIVMNHVDANIWLVLTLPAFEWILVDQSHASARFGHTCHLVCNRQLVSIGGLDAGQKNPWSTPDLRAPQGVSVFDVSELRWVAGYTANAPHYERASVIQNFYDTRKYEKIPGFQPAAEAR